MAANRVVFNTEQKDLARKIARSITMVREGKQLLDEARGILIQTRDGDGSDAANYDLIAFHGGYEQSDYASPNAAAKKSFEEIDALWGALDNIQATIDQCCAIHGV